MLYATPNVCTESRLSEQKQSRIIEHFVAGIQAMISLERLKLTRAILLECAKASVAEVLLKYWYKQASR